MKCQQFSVNLQTLLDSAGKKLSDSEERHMRNCENCRLTYAQMWKLQSAARSEGRRGLSQQAEAFLVDQISDRVFQHEAASRSSLVRRMVLGARAVRWDRALVSAALATAGILLILTLSNPRQQQTTGLPLDHSLDLLLEEHAMAMDSGIFQGTSQYAKLIATTDEER